ncbi:MAG: LPXTG cell wall anchor domain-containing protein [Provencibacterium sp.]|nr:LPXTG cell wall anchor domain-containing protein [Provencibacterium sp.]
MNLKKWRNLLLSGMVFAILLVSPAFASTGNPATGDHSMIGVVAAVLVVSLVVIAALVVVGIKKKRR